MGEMGLEAGSWNKSVKTKADNKKFSRKYGKGGFSLWAI
jgi:hypothetical protein